MSETIDQLRAQIKSVAKSKYPAMQNFTLSDKAIKKFMKDFKGDINKIVDELYRIVGQAKNPRTITLMSEAGLKD